MSSPPSPDPRQSQASTSDDSRVTDPDDADTGPLPVSSPRLSAEQRWHAGQGAWANKFDAPLMVNPRPAPRMERKPIVFLGAVALAIVVVGGLIFWLLRPSTDTQSAPPAPVPTTTPSPETGRLLRLVPTGYSSDACKPVSTPKDVLAQVDCARNTDQGGPTTASYTLVGDKTALEAVFNGIVQASARVNCPGNIQSPGPWRRNATPDKVSGVLFCGVQDGRPTVAWSDESRLLIGKAQSGQQGPTFDELYAWWSSHS